MSNPAMERTLSETRRRVLVVDDDRSVIEGLRRAFRVLQPDWEVVVAASGGEALGHFRQSRFDAVLTDMRMPVMTGADLLAEVRSLRPECVRMVLTGFANQDLINRCLGVAHQCLSKPCSALVVSQALERAIQREARGASRGVRELVGRLDRLPSMPAVYAALLELVQSPSVQLEEVGALVSKDAGLSAKLLQLVNSAFFGLSRVIASPAEAVTHLGLETLKSLVLGVGVFSSFPGSHAAGVEIAQEWRHGLATADLARRIVRDVGGSSQVGEEAFTAGLLHDAGRLILAFNCMDEAERVGNRLKAGESRTLTEAEESVFGCSHAEVGGYLFGLWGLPTAVVEAIAGHHQPAESSVGGFTAITAITAVHAADFLDREAGDPAAAAIHGSLDLEYLRALGLEPRLAAWRELRDQASKGGGS